MKTFYYSDELNDDFAENGIKTKRIPSDYEYFTRSPLRRAAAFVLYHFIAFPLVFLLQKIAYGEKTAAEASSHLIKKPGCSFTATIRESWGTLIRLPLRFSRGKLIS